MKKASITCYIRYYRLIAAAVVITVAVITGSLMVGESVRTTLVNRVYERLGNTETLLFSKNSFFDSALSQDVLFGGTARPVLLTNGFIPDAGRLLPVMVWGMDGMDIPTGSVKINRPLAAELSGSLQEGGDIVLRLPATGMVPSGSLFVTKNYTTSARLAYAGTLDAAHGGNLNLKNEQTLPYNLFINRTELASILDVEDKINLILSDKLVSADDFARAWTPALSGIKVTPDKGDTFDITSDRVFIQEEAVQTICRDNPGANRIFSYMANAIESGGNSIPYSFVSAIDRYKGRTLEDDEVILSDYTAARLHAKINDSIRLTYYVSEDMKTLRTDTFHARVADIVPLAEWVADKTLSADFPGLSDVERCTDWDSDLPIDMSLITQEDEDYWHLYRSTPKALLPYRSVGQRWSNAYGSATAIRTGGGVPHLDGLTAAMFGIQFIYPKEIGLSAARNGVDFASLFLSLGFFIILSALLLMLVPLSEMLWQRRHETALLTALGFPRKRIIGMLWREASPVVFTASLVGIVAGIVYTWLILLLLGTLWKGATQTGGFSIFAGVQTLLAGFIVGTGIVLLLLRIAIGRTLKPPKQPKIKPAASPRKEPAVLSHSRLLRESLHANKKRALLSFFTLASGVLIVFSVGLNRKGFSDSSQLRAGTGGYTLWCESSIPVYHNMATAQGREKLALTALPGDAEVMQILRYSADDASCLNLNKVSQPTVLGVDMEQLRNSDFRIQQNIYSDTETLFAALATATDSVYPALIDETVLTWGLMLKAGDTLRYESTNGRQVCLRLVGTLQNSIFQGNILMDKKQFGNIWSEITGSEISLYKVKEPEANEVRLLLSQALNEYGVKVTLTATRLKEFESVTDTYLTIFLTLGGLGLLLGVMGFIIVVRKDLASRGEQIRLYRSLGFTDTRIVRILTSENRLVPLCAVAIGVAGSLAGVSGGLQNVSIHIWLLTLVLTLLLVACILVFIRKSVWACLADKELDKSTN